MSGSRAILAFFVLLSFTCPASAQLNFKRGDSNADGELNIADGIHVLSFLFSGGGPPPCRDAADANDDGTIDISDGLWTLTFLFVGGPPPKAPFPDCGTDPTGDDTLDCQSYTQCSQLPTFPHPDPDPCGQIGGPCESMVIGPYTLVSTPDDTGVLTIATHRDGRVFSLEWKAAEGDSADLIFGVPAGPSLDPIRIQAGVPTLPGANILAGLLLLLNTSEAALVKGFAAARKPSSNHAGCDPNELLGWADCSPLGVGRCCDLHDGCIFEECNGPNDSGDLRVCTEKALTYLECLAGGGSEHDCNLAYPLCSPRCSACHALVTACFALSIEFPLFAAGKSHCCERGDCGLPQQCIIGEVVETNASKCPHGSGTGWGDVHLITYDRLAYDFQGVGEFVMTRSEGRDLEVQARTAPYGASRRVSITKAAAMNVAGDRVAVYVDRSPALYVNGVPTELGAQPLGLPNGGKIQTSGGSYFMVWPDSSQLQVTSRGTYLNLQYLLPPSRGATLEGLLGNFDGNRDNDLTSRNGTVLGLHPSPLLLYGMYGESWRITQAESLFDYFDGATTETYSDRTFPDGVVNSTSLSPPAKSAAEAACSAAGVTDPALLESCMVDVGLTGDDSFAASAAEVLPPEGSVQLPPCTNSQVTWVDWTSGNATQAAGSAAGVTVTFSGNLSPAPLLGVGGNFWSVVPTTYTKPGIVDSAPAINDMIRLTGGPATGTQTLSFSSPVVDPVMIIFSLGAPRIAATYNFDAPFHLLNTGPGYYGNGLLEKRDGNVLAGNEGYGLIQFHGVISAISWTLPVAEYWHGFQVGLLGCQ